MKIFLLLLSLLVFTSSCSDSNEDLLEKLKTAVTTENEVAKDYTVISMDSLTEFEWDTLYFFQENEDDRAISERIGFKWKGPAVPELYRRLLFVHNGHVVSYTDYDYTEFPLAVYGCKTDSWVYPRSRSRFATFTYCTGGDQVHYPFIQVECVENIIELAEQKCPEGVETAVAE